MSAINLEKTFNMVYILNMGRNKTVKRKSSNVTHSRSSMIATALAMLVLLGVVGFIIMRKASQIEASNAESAAKLASLSEEYESEEARSEELDEYYKYTFTKQFVEDVARSKFGLVYPDEIIFKSEE